MFLWVHVLTPPSRNPRLRLQGSAVLTIGPRRAEVRQRIIGQGITATNSLSWICCGHPLQSEVHVKHLKTTMDNVRHQKNFRYQIWHWLEGRQIIQTKPIPNEDLRVKKDGHTGASHIFSLKIHCTDGSCLFIQISITKRVGSRRAQRWCCLRPDPQSNRQWKIPNDWYRKPERNKKSSRMNRNGKV
jgi:hypothetical protein